ncbi:AIPR family protein [Nocardia xishanensis]|uniref:AIPR family protein n=1 Tax=Nocardia xishanensis TaxID=238964 RepID=UPI003449400D
MSQIESTTSNEVVLLNQRLSHRKQQTYPELSNNEYFLISSIDTVLRARGLSSRQIEDGIVEGADDGGIDAVYLFVNGQLVEDVSDIGKGDDPRCELEIFQVKEERGFKEVVLQKLMDHLPELLQLEAPRTLPTEFNPRILERLETFRNTYFELADKFPELAIRIRYVTKSAEAPHEKVTVKSGRLKARVRESFSHAEVTVDMIGAAQLNAMARQRKASTLALRVTEGPISPEKGGLVCLVSLEDYFRFITNEDGSLRDGIFEDNVRDYEGDTVINKEITESLRQGNTSSADFWWLNNGVTILGKKVQPANKHVTIEDPQIVNGLQTSRSVYQHFAAPSRRNGEHATTNRPEGSDSRHILIRVIEPPDESLSSQIIKATNSQNRVSAASLRAAEPFQRDIEEFFHQRGHYYERRKNHYKNMGKPRTQIVEVQELAQAVGSILLQQPDTARGRPASLVRGKLYDKVFNQTSTPLAAYWNCFLVMKRMDNFLVTRDGTAARHDRSNIRFHLARAACAFALRSSRPRANMVAKMRMEVFTDDFLQEVLKWLLEARAKTERTIGVSDANVLAKGSEWAAEINRKLSMYTDKSAWPKKLMPAST